MAERPELSCVAEPVLSAREALMQSIAALGREVADRVKQRPACRLLMSVPHAGPLTALTYTKG